MSEVRKQMVDNLKVGDVLRVELCFMGHSYLADDGTIQHDLGGSMFILKFEKEGLVLGSILVSDFSDAHLGNIILNPSNPDDENEDIMAVLQIYCGSMFNPAWEGSLLRVVAINGVAA